MAEALAEVQEACFPTLSPAERIRAEHYRAHVDLFPEGQHAVIETATGRPVASSTDFRTRVDFGHYQHRYHPGNIRHRAICALIEREYARHYPALPAASP